jgi:hypothetical protein
VSFGPTHPGLWVASLGIVALYLEPTPGVLWSTWFCARKPRVVDALVALVVLVELLMSAWMGV